MKKIISFLCIISFSTSAFAFNNETAEVFRSILDYFKHIETWKAPDEAVHFEAYFAKNFINQIIEEEHGTEWDFYSYFAVYDVMKDKYIEDDEDLNLDFGVYHFFFDRTSHAPVNMLLIYNHKIELFPKGSDCFVRHIYKLKDKHPDLMTDSDLVRIFRWNSFNYGSTKLDTMDIIFKKIGCINYLPSKWPMNE